MAVTQGHIQVAADSTGKLVDNTLIVRTGSTYYRQVTVLGDPETDAAFAAVLAADPGSSSYGVVTRLIGTAPLPTGAATAARQPALGAAGTASTDVLSVQGRAGMTPVVVDGSTTTQPISVASLPLPSGAATVAKQPALGAAGTASTDVLTVQGRAGMTALLVDGTATTQPISAAALPLPSGAATVAKQPAISAAGTASTDLLTVQGSTGGVAFRVDGSAVTQPVSGTVTANAGTNLNTSLLALEGGGNLATIVTNSGAAATSLAILDDWDETDRAKVNPIAGQAGVQGGAGAVSALTQRVVSATDDPGVASLALISTNSSGTATSTAAAAVSLAILDDWDESDRAKVNPIAGQAGVAAGAGSVSATVQRMTLASDDPAVASLAAIDADTSTIITNTGAATTALQIMDDWDNAASDGASVSGDVAHDTADAGEPVKVGFKAIDHGANPTAVTAADRTNAYADRHGRQFIKNAHPNAKTFVYLTTGAQTDDNVLVAIGGGTKYGLQRLKITLDEATTVGVAVRLGFGTSVVPALPTTGSDAVDDIICYHPGLVPGSIFDALDGSGEVVGADGAELRITCEAPTGGTLVVQGTYYTIEG